MKSGLVPGARHLAWPLHGFETVPRSPSDEAAKTRRYPIRYLRYWFARSVLQELHAKLGRPLRVLEVGVDLGGMLAFLGGRETSPDVHALPEWIERWDGLDMQIDPAVLKRYSYTDFFKLDVERSEFQAAQPYDAIVLLHVLEHLNDPEGAMHRLLPAIAPHGLLVGGSPTMPSWARAFYEPFLRVRYRDTLHDAYAHKHLSVITPARIKRFARQEGLSVDLLTGAFFFRWSGSRLEDSELWLRANLLWGTMFRSLGGEIYFSLGVAA